MTRTHNLNAVRDARVTKATSVAGSRHSRKKEQAPRRASSQIASQRSQTPSGAPPSGIEVIGTGITQNVAPPPVSFQDGANQEMKAMVQDMAKSSLTQLGVMPQDTPTQSRAQSSNEDLEPPQIEDISAEGEISDQEDHHSGTPVLNQLLMVVEEQADYESFPSPVVTRPPL